MRKLLVVAIFAAVVVAACEGGTDSIARDEKASEQALANLQNAHPVPLFQRSQLRQNLVEIVTAQAETTQTTTFFFNLGVADPINQCPSIGFPIPATAQLTNPDQIIGGETDVTIAQVEPTGVYTGDTTGTYAMCIDAQGRAYAVYWEGFVQTVTGPAEWVDGQVKLVGPPSFEFTAEKP